MKLYSSIGPNPRVVAMFLAEKGAELETIEVDIMSGENRKPEFLKINPTGQSPALQLDDGSVINEITVICDYLDQKLDGPSLMGDTPEQQAQTRMWCRRIDIHITEPMANGFRWGDAAPMFEGRIRLIPEAADGMKALAQDGLAWIDGLIEGPYICGERFTVADILLFCFLEFGTQIGQTVDPSNSKVTAWYDAVSQRASVAASVHPSMRG